MILNFKQICRHELMVIEETSKDCLLFFIVASQMLPHQPKSIKIELDDEFN